MEPSSFTEGLLEGPLGPSPQGPLPFLPTPPLPQPSLVGPAIGPLPSWGSPAGLSPTRPVRAGEAPGLRPRLHTTRAWRPPRQSLQLPQGTQRPLVSLGRKAPLGRFPGGSRVNHIRNTGKGVTQGQSKNEIPASQARGLQGILEKPLFLPSSSCLVTTVHLGQSGRQLGTTGVQAQHPGSVCTTTRCGGRAPSCCFPRPPEQGPVGTRGSGEL